MIHQEVSNKLEDFITCWERYTLKRLPSEKQDVLEAFDALSYEFSKWVVAEKKWKEKEVANAKTEGHGIKISILFGGGCVVDGMFYPGGAIEKVPEREVSPDGGGSPMPGGMSTTTDPNPNAYAYSRTNTYPNPNPIALPYSGPFSKPYTKA